MYKKNEKEDGLVEVRHCGAHHDFNLQLDKSMKPRGSLIAYGDNSFVVANIDAKGRLSGKVVHSGSEHAEEIILNKDGTWEGTLTHKSDKGDLAVSFKKGRAKGIGDLSGKVSLSGKSHKLNLGIDKKSISGKLDFTSGIGKGSIKVSNNKVSGKLQHKGNTHTIGIELLENGKWKGNFTAKKGNLQMSIDVKEGEGKATFSANF